MKINLAVLGAFVVSALILFTIGLFLIGSSNQTFSHHKDLYVEMANVNGVAPGTKVRAEGIDAGQVLKIELPPRPSARFRLMLQIDEKLHSLIREDSVVTIESDGLVGDKFLLIHHGTDGSQEAANGYTLPSKEPFDLNAMIAKASGVIDQANATLGDVHAKLDGALDAVTTTVHNTNGLVTDARTGKGAVGMLLNDRQTAEQIKQVVSNAQQVSVNLNQVSVQAKQLVTDVQSRNFPAKLDDTVASANHAVKQLDHASQQIDQVSQQVNATLADALGPDNSGANAAENLRETLSNVNVTTANLADDTEALKHEFFFRGFFKKRGYYSLSSLTPEQYRSTAYFSNPRNQRFWVSEEEAFTRDANGSEILSMQGEQQINQIIGSAKEAAESEPIVVEGYSGAPQADQQFTLSRTHALLIARYLEKHFHLHSTRLGVVFLNATPPQSSGKTSWDGASIVFLAKEK